MNPVDHPSNNGILHAPNGWSNESMLPCESLPVTMVEGGMPPVMLGVDDGTNA